MYEKKHEKSVCCNENIWKLNSRRRQCSKCKKTWRVWPKKLGRKSQRINFEFLFKYLKNESGSIRQRALSRGICPVALQRHMIKTANKFNETTPWPEIPSGDLVAIADALVEYIDGVRNTIYLILIRSINSNKAAIMPCFVAVNRGEDFGGWDSAFNLIQPDARQRIRALVCDGRSAFGTMSKKYNWVLQRCHFHLLARIAHNRSIRHFSRTSEQGKYIQSLAQIVLISKNEDSVKNALNKLKELMPKIASRCFKTVISGFLKNYLDYRSYLNYPEYSLPTTSNSAEHLVGIIRDLQYRARGFNSVKSLKLWVECLLKFTKFVTCNGKISIPN